MRPMRSHPLDVSRRIVDALGLGDQLVRSLVLRVDTNSAPTVEVEIELDEVVDGELVTELRRYELVARTEDVDG